MKRLRFDLARLPVFSSDTSLALFGDLGSGTVDLTRPLPPGLVRFWPAAAGRAGHLIDGHVVAGHLDGVVADGHLTGGHELDGHLTPSLVVSVSSPRYVFGRFRHELRFFDGAGNVTAAGAQAFVHTINEAPDVPDAPRRIGWDAAKKRVCFAINPVRFVAVAGA